MEIEKPNNLSGRRGESQKIFDEDLVLPTKTFEEINAFANMVTAADTLTALGVGSFSISETDFHDPDGIKIHYIGDRGFTDFLPLAYTFTLEMKNGKTVEAAARIAVFIHPKVSPKNPGNA